MKQRKQILNKLGCFSPHLSQHLLRLLLLLVTAIGGVGSSWAAKTYEYYKIGSNETNTNDFFTTVPTNDKSGKTVAKVINGEEKNLQVRKMESNSSFTFTTTGYATVTVGIWLNADISNNISNNQFKIDGTTYTGTVTTAEASEEVVVTNVAPGTHTITRQNKEIGIYYVKVVEEDAASDAAPYSMTSLIKDASFDGAAVNGNNLGGWTWSKNGGNGPQYPYNASAANTTAAEFWNGQTTANLDFSLYQTLSNLPAGTYKLSAKAGNAQNIEGSKGGFAVLFANVGSEVPTGSPETDAFGCPSAKVNVVADAKENAGTYNVYFKLDNTSDVTIGFKNFGTPDGRWFYCDDFTLEYYGTESTHTASADATILKELKEFRSGGGQATHFKVGEQNYAHNLVLTFKDGESISLGEGNFKIESSNTEVATVAWRQMNTNGPSIKFDAVSAGSADITVTFHADGFKSRTVTIPVTVAAPVNVTFATEDANKGTVSAKTSKGISGTNSNTGDMTSGNTIPAGTVVKFTATPADGYEFDGWYSGADLVSPDVEYTTTVNADVNITAKFKTASLPSTSWVFEEGNDDGAYTQNGINLVAYGVSWQSAGLKLDSNDAYFTFTPNADGILTVKGTVFKNNSPLITVTQNGNEISCNEEVKSGSEVTYNVVAGQPVTIKRTGSEIRIAEIDFTPTGNIMLVAPTISVEGNVVTFTNPNEGSTLYYKYDRTKEGEIKESNFDGSSTEATKQIILPYGVYPAEWIQAQVGNAEGQSSAITKYAEEVTVAPPTPVLTKTDTELTFTVPTGCFVEFHVGSADAEPIAVYSTTATVTLNADNKMIINNVGNKEGVTELTYDIATLHVKTVAEYNRKDNGTSSKGYIGSELIEVTPENTKVKSVTIPTAIEIHVGQTLAIGPTVVTKNNVSTADMPKSWVLVSGSDYLTLSNTNRTSSSIIGKKSNTSDNATATVKAVFDGVESNVCTVTIKRAPLAVRADHVALSHNGNASRTLKAIAYNPYNRAVISSNIDLTAAIKSGSSAFATSTGNTITPTGTAIGTEIWTVTAAPKTGKAEENLYTAGTADIQVTCRDYLYAYSTSKPATAPTARPVTNAENDIALNYYAGHNPAECKESADAEPLATWGTANRGPQEQTLTYVQSGKRPYARIDGWDGIKNVAEPTMNSLSEQHTRNASPVYNGNSNGTFTYKAYNYSGTHDEFNVPVMGSFYRFYPEKNGTLIAYLCVNGQFSDSDMNALVSGSKTSLGYANRKTYFLDPYANSMDIQNATVQPTSTIQPGFFHYTLENCTGLDNFKADVVTLLNNWSAWGNDEKKPSGELIIPVKSTSYAEGKTSYTIDDVDWTNFKKLGEDRVGIFHQPIANGDGSFRVITKTYVRCEIPVEKGRVYYVSPTGTKTRMAGVEFIVADNDNDPVANVKLYSGKMDGEKTDTNPYIVPAGQNNFFKDVNNNGKYFNVTLQDRSFNAGEWYSFCMPFDVPQKQIHDIFGADAITIHFDEVTENEDGSFTMNFWSHFYDQIRAGRPIMIKMPTEFPDGSTKLEEASVTFKHVKLNLDEDAQPEKLYMSDANGWTFKGTYDPVRMGKNAIIINGTNFYHYKNTEKTLAGNRAWIQGPANSQASIITSITMFNDVNGDETTGIEAVLSEMGYNVMKTTDKIYNLNGQMVGQGADINNLPKGVYIVNGKKQIVK